MIETPNRRFFENSPENSRWPNLGPDRWPNWGPRLP